MTVKVRLLERVLRTLPVSAELNPYLDAAVIVLISALIVYTKLQNVSVLAEVSTVLYLSLRQLTLICVGRDSVFGLESRIWFKKVPELLAVSRMKNWHAVQHIVSTQDADLSTHLSTEVAPHLSVIPTDNFRLESHARRGEVATAARDIQRRSADDPICCAGSRSSCGLIGSSCCSCGSSRTSLCEAPDLQQEWRGLPVHPQSRRRRLGDSCAG